MRGRGKDELHYPQASPMATAAVRSSLAPPGARAHKWRPLLYAAAVLLAVSTVYYSAAWMYYTRLQEKVEIGIDTRPVRGALEVTRVYKDSPAERAGLKATDNILAVNGKPARLEGNDSPVRIAAWLKAKPGDTVVLTVQRPGVPQPLQITPYFRAARGSGDAGTVARSVAERILATYPILFLVVGLVVLFLRVEDPNAWLLAVLFASFIAVAGLPNSFALAPLHAFLVAYRTLLSTLLAPLFYFFFAVFPTRSPIDRKAPWLKWVLLLLLAALDLGGIRVGALLPLPFLLSWLGESVTGWARLVLGYGSVALGLLSLALNVLTAATIGDRRKLKVMLWGTIVGVTPAALIGVLSEVLRFEEPFWVNFAKVFLLFVFPLSFAYAVVKHRVMDIPVLLRRSARYFMVERGFVFLILALSVGVTFWFAQAFSRYFSAGSKAAIPVGATFGVLVISGATQVHRRVRTRLDRAFFRGAYDAQQILENLAAQTLTVTSRNALAELLWKQIEDALHPRSLYVYLANGGRQLLACAGNPPPQVAALSTDAPGIAELAGRSDTLELFPEAMSGTPLAPLAPECLVPIRGSSDSDLQGVAVLGPRLSEEPYSASDRRLLSSVASQAGIAMRSITLAEKMAQSMEAERRAAQEMQIASQVQSRLLPQEAPALRTLECAGKCIQTRAVGGDYYDFLDLGSGRLGLVLADISGKGISAALLMANLQASLRGQYALAIEDVRRLLCSVNRLFCKNTEAARYATAFFSVYDDESRLLRYVNCGHNPPILLRANGHLERLPATATVLGLFEDWDCLVADCSLAAGDVLVIYTDGVSEVGPKEDVEFGDERLVELVRQHQRDPAGEILDAIIAAVQDFSQGEQADDMTLIVAKTVRYPL
jgi:phosphoserine phosphatase RsbU/P